MKIDIMKFKLDAIVMIQNVFNKAGIMNKNCFSMFITVGIIQVGLLILLAMINAKL